MSERLSNEAVFYPTSAPPPATPQSPVEQAPPNATQPLGDASTEKKPTSEQKDTPRQSESNEDIFYSDPAVLAQNYEPNIGSSLDRLMADGDLPNNDRTEVLHEAATLFNDVGMPPGEASQFMDLYTGAMTSRPIGDDEIAQWNASLPIELTARYGKPEYEARLGKVRAFVKSVPGLTEALEVSGLGAHPRVVAALMERAHTLKPRAKRHA